MNHFNRLKFDKYIDILFEIIENFNKNSSFL